MNLYSLLKPLIFKLDPEDAHNFFKKIVTCKLISPSINFFLDQFCSFKDDSLRQKIFDMEFDSPLGIASGYDKNAEMIQFLTSIGFSFVEIGSVTLNPQNGNPRPRIFRHEKEMSIQNMMGFNNIGALEIKKNLNHEFKVPIGVNIGKNKDAKDALKNYESSFNHLKNSGDYFVFNLSSPNTPNLRDLQNKTFIKEISQIIKNHNKPSFIKISPDMDKVSLFSVCEALLDSKLSGIICSNTTIDYACVNSAINQGGLSGEVLKIKSRKMLKLISSSFFNDFKMNSKILISVGGISDADEAYCRIRLGANLIQIYSGIIYNGPMIVKKINYGLSKMLKIDGFKNINEAIGIDIN